MSPAHSNTAAPKSLTEFNPKLLYSEPAKVSVSDPYSVAPMPSQILKMPRGGISIWVYVNPFDQGIRHLVNNRYIISHDTNDGKEKVAEDKTRYINVFSLSRGPMCYQPPSNPEWKLWMTNGEGETWFASYTDSRDLSVGWHHFLIRWNHGKPLIELLIDGTIVINGSDYYKFWPTEFSTKLLIGNWATRWEGHSVETYLWRAQPIYEFPDKHWIEEELKNVPPILMQWQSANPRRQFEATQAFSAYIKDFPILENALVSVNQISTLLPENYQNMVIGLERIAEGQYQRNVAVLGSRVDEHPNRRKLCQLVGSLLGKSGHVLIHGSSDVGQEVAKSFHSINRTPGYILNYRVKKEVQPLPFGSMIDFQNIEELRNEMIDRADFFIVIGGRSGTQTEITHAREKGKEVFFFTEDVI